jgi:membrane protease YdiL (CAAX protease family)
MVVSTRKVPGIMCALQDDGAAPPAATQPTRSLPPLKLWPIIAAVGLLVFVLMVDGAVIVVTLHFIGEPMFKAMPWTVLYFGHTGILLAALLCIALLGHGRFREFGFKAPADNRYVHTALFFGVLFGIMMTAADQTHNIIAYLPPENFSLSSTNLVGSLTFEGLYGGTVEEILFRGLLMTFLMQRMSGRFRLGRFDVHVAGVIVAVLFSLAHLGSFWTESFRVAASQQAYAFVFGVIYAYWCEKSCSLLPSIIGHNLGNLVEYLFAFLMVWRWS